MVCGRDNYADMLAGLEETDALRLRGQGHSGRYGGPSGDVYLSFMVRLHHWFPVHGNTVAVCSAYNAEEDRTHTVCSGTRAGLQANLCSCLLIDRVRCCTAQLPAAPVQVSKLIFVLAFSLIACAAARRSSKRIPTSGEKARRCSQRCSCPT